MHDPSPPKADFSVYLTHMGPSNTGDHRIVAKSLSIFYTAAISRAEAETLIGKMRAANPGLQLAGKWTGPVEL